MTNAKSILTRGSGRAAILLSYLISNHTLFHQRQNFGNGFPSRIFSISKPKIQHLCFAALAIPRIIPLYLTQLVPMQAQLDTEQMPILNRLQLV